MKREKTPEHENRTQDNYKTEHRNSQDRVQKLTIRSTKTQRLSQSYQSFQNWLRRDKKPEQYENRTQDNYKFEHRNSQDRAQKLND